MNKIKAVWNYFFTPSPFELATSALRKATIARLEAEQGRDWSVAMLDYQGKRETALREFLAASMTLPELPDPVPPTPAASAPAADYMTFEASPGPRRRAAPRTNLAAVV
jgi:hypothetical protein